MIYAPLIGPQEARAVKIGVARQTAIAGSHWCPPMWVGSADRDGGVALGEGVRYVPPRVRLTLSRLGGFAGDAALNGGRVREGLEIDSISPSRRHPLLPHGAAHMPRLIQCLAGCRRPQTGRFPASQSWTASLPSPHTRPA